LASPLTTDRNYLNEILQITGPQAIKSQGTDIGLGMEIARKALERGAENSSLSSSDSGATGLPPQSSQVVILISDGEDQEDGALAAAKALKERGVKLYVIGVGSEKGGPIPLRDDNGNLIGYKKDRNGQPIVSRFNPGALMKLSQAGGGRYFNASTDEGEVQEMLQDMGALNRTDFAERRIIVYQDRFQYPLLIAVLLLLLEVSLPMRRKKFAEGAAPGVAVFFVLGALLGSSQVRADNLSRAMPSLDTYLENEKGVKAFQEGKVAEAQKSFGTAQALNPDLPELGYNQGVIQLQQGDTESALREFGQVAQKAMEKGDSSLAAKSLYNLGQALQKKGDTRGAAQSYLGAIESSRLAKDEKLEQQARKNLELLEAQRQKQKQEQKKEQDQKDQGKQGDKKDQKEEQGKEDQKKQPGDQGKEQQKNEPKQFQDTSKNKKQQSFQSKNLTKDDADRVMNELGNRERELQAKLKKQNGTSQKKSNSKDW
jgi:Ca-activated chloride channel family protein